ncbi:MAG: hypothetical protein ACRDD8_05960 [Bacteroidales bacterium]
MEEQELSKEQIEAIKKHVTKLCDVHKLRKIFPIVVFGDVNFGEKETYVAYMREPSFSVFSKFMTLSKKDDLSALKQLAKDCFLDGDRELIDDESLFIFGLSGQMTEIVSTRKGMLVGF